MATCFAVASPTFQPAMRIVSAITNANPAATTTFDHDYATGLIVRLLVPFDHGMVEADKLVGAITVTGVTTFTIDIDTRNLGVFSIPGSTNFCPQVLPVGEINSLLTQATRNVLLD